MHSIRTQPDGVEEKLKPKGRREPSLQSQQTVVFGYDVGGVEHVLVVDWMMTSLLQFPLQLHSNFYHFQRVGEEPGTDRGQSGDGEVHVGWYLSFELWFNSLQGFKKGFILWNSFNLTKQFIGTLVKTRLNNHFRKLQRRFGIQCFSS